MIETLLAILTRTAAAGAGDFPSVGNPIPRFTILAQGIPIPGLADFVTFLQTISILVGICLLLFGSWQTHQGRVSDGALSIIAGFMSCVTVPVIRLIARATGGSL
jgi:hypothetical protein